MVKNLTHFPLYLPPKGQLLGWDGEAAHSVRHWLNREICNSAGGAFDAPSPLASAPYSGRGSQPGRNAMTFVAR
ncbi:hypothetical protein C8D04_1883 [Simplicispira sp. 125]|nr:hypothetical protein C8D04_1883 [Simplicispira sp. 125]REG17566.1 hypothetical protein C8D01_2193 [Simplicispira sp. 110]